MAFKRIVQICSDKIISLFQGISIQCGCHTTACGSFSNGRICRPRGICFLWICKLRHIQNRAHFTAQTAINASITFLHLKTRIFFNAYHTGFRTYILARAASSTQCARCNNFTHINILLRISHELLRIASSR